MADDSQDQYSALVAPVLLGFTLGTAATIATHADSLLWKGWPMFFFLLASSALLVSVQLTAGPLYRRSGFSANIRQASTNVGMVAFAAGLVLLVWPTRVPPAAVEWLARLGDPQGVGLTALAIATVVLLPVQLLLWIFRSTRRGRSWFLSGRRRWRSWRSKANRGP